MPGAVRIDTRKPGNWTNFHGNVSQPVECVYDVFNVPNAHVSDLKETVTAIQSLLAQAEHDRARLRAYGGRWSLSTAAWTDGRLLQTGEMRAWFMLRDSDFVTAFQGPRNGVVFAQCGLSVDVLNAQLKLRGRSIRASGASNGQTVVGAMSTGTHGSAFNIGSLQDHIVALQIITSPTDCVWLERSTYPVATDALLDLLGSRRIADDALFNAALVSFGSFGVIHGVLLETDPLYLLTTHRETFPLAKTLQLCTAGSFDPSRLGYSSFSRIANEQQELYHLEFVMNPIDPAKAWVTTMYKGSYRTNYQKPDAGSYGPGPDLLGIFGYLQDHHSQPFDQFLKWFSSSFYDAAFDHVGTFGEIFCATDPKGSGTSMEIGCAVSDLERVIQIMVSCCQVNPVGGFAGIRFVRSSRATLGFTRFAPITCTLEIEGLDNIATQTFFEAFWGALDQAGIRYTFHWGQVNNLSPQRLLSMYGATAINTWKRTRTTLLTPTMQGVFSSPFLEQCGLHGPPPPQV